MQPNQRLTATLSAGRKLGYAEFGAAGGRPVFYFHGFPGSRLEGALADATAARFGLRLVAVDRPGYGLSDDKPRRTLSGWAADVAELADYLHAERFGVLGASGGAPFALACARMLNDRLDAAAIACGLGPAETPGVLRGMMWRNRLGLRFAIRAPRLAAWLFEIVAGRFQRDPERSVTRFANKLPEPDRSVLLGANVKPVFLDTLCEAFRSGTRGAARDLVLYSTPWDFAIEDIAMQVHLLQGESDTIIPPGMARYLERTIPDCRATYFPGEGHFSLIANRQAEILGVFR